MTCLKPTTIKTRRLTGEEYYINVPCGKCICCQKNRYMEWSLRLQHEMQYHEKASFITLTYSDEYLPTTDLCSRRPLQLFIKRLRKRFPQSRVKYFAAGEFGSLHGRLHYHLIIFGWSPEKKDLFRVSPASKYFYSKTLMKLWPFGFNTVEGVTGRTCGYVAKYIMKQSVLKNKRDFTLPWTQKSQGLGARWCLSHLSQVAGDMSIQDGKWFKPVPRYYRKLVDKFYPGLFAEGAWSQFAVDRYYDLLYRWHKLGVFDYLTIFKKERERLVQLERTLVDKATNEDPDGVHTRYTRCVYPENQGIYARIRK